MDLMKNKVKGLTSWRKEIKSVLTVYMYDTQTIVLDLLCPTKPSFHLPINEPLQSQLPPFYPNLTNNRSRHRYTPLILLYIMRYCYLSIGYHRTFNIDTIVSNISSVIAAVVPPNRDPR